jgi:hypothetical protein
MKVDRIEDLEIRIFIIGYKKEGEAIVVLFLDKVKKEVHFSMAIDSYAYKGSLKSYRNFTDDILRKYHVKNLSVLCWTHPHLDHSKGLLKIFHKYCRNSTKVIKPIFFDNKSTDVVKIYDKETKRLVEAIFKLNALNKDTIINSKAPGGGYEMPHHFKIESKNAQPKKVEIRLLSPVDSIVFHHFKNGTTLPDLNGISVSMILDVDGYSVMFGGDTINDHIRLMNPDDLKECRLVKTPHHSSLTGREMALYMNPAMLDSACTTIKNKSLPNIGVVEEYKKKTDHFFSTGYNDCTPKGSTYYGIVEYVIGYDNLRMHMDVNLFGNAHRM